MKKPIFLSALLVMISSLAFSQDTTKKAAELPSFVANPMAVAQQLDSLTLRIQINPHNDTAYLSRAFIQIALNKNFRGGIIDCTEAMKGQHFVLDALVLRASAKDSIADYKGSIADLDSALRLVPPGLPAGSMGQIYGRRGFAEGSLGNLTGALADYDKQVELDPGASIAYLQRGLVKQGLEDYKGAIADNDKAITLDTNNVAAYNNRAFVKIKQKDFAGAITDCDIAIKRDTEGMVPAFAYANRGYARHGLKDEQNATADFTKSIQINPNNAMVYYYRGLQEYDLKDYKSATADFDKAIALGPEDRPFYTARANLKDAIGDHAGAKKDRAKAATLKMGYMKI